MTHTQIKGKLNLLSNINRAIESKKTVVMAKMAVERKKIRSITESEKGLQSFIESSPKDIASHWYSNYSFKKRNKTSRTLWIAAFPNIELLDQVRKAYIEDINKHAQENDYLVLIGDFKESLDDIKCKNVVCKYSKKLEKQDVREQAATIMGIFTQNIFDTGVVYDVKAIRIAETTLAWKSETILPLNINDEKPKNKVEYEYIPSINIFMKSVIQNYIKAHIIETIASIYIFELKAKLIIYENSISKIKELRKEYMLKGFKVRQAKVTSEILSIMNAYEVLKDED